MQFIKSRLFPVILHNRARLSLERGRYRKVQFSCVPLPKLILIIQTCLINFFMYLIHIIFSLDSPLLLQLAWTFQPFTHHLLSDKLQSKLFQWKLIDSSNDTYLREDLRLISQRIILGCVACLIELVSHYLIDCTDNANYDHYLIDTRKLNLTWEDDIKLVRCSSVY